MRGETRVRFSEESRDTSPTTPCLLLYSRQRSLAETRVASFPARDAPICSRARVLNSAWTARVVGWIMYISSVSGAV